MTLRDIERMVKSLRAQTMPAGNEVKDHWTEGQVNAAPSRREIGYGPVEAAWGGGAERMIGRYSNPAPQRGATRTAGELARDLGETMRDAGTLQRAISVLTERTAKLAAIAANQAEWATCADDEDDPAEKAYRLRRAARAERRAAADAAKATNARDRRIAERKAEKAKQATNRLLAQQLDEMQKAVEGIAPLKTSVGEMMNFLLSRGKAGGAPPMQVRKGAAGRDEVLKSVALAMNHMGPLERSHAETIVRMMQGGVGADVIRKRLDGVGGNVAIALRPLVEIG